MLKVAVVTNYFPTSAEPWAGQSAYQTLRKLAKKCDVHVFCAVPQYPRFLAPRRNIENIDLNWQPPDVKVTYVSFLSIPVVSRPFNGYTIARRLLPHVRVFSPDIILNYVVYPHGFAAVKIARSLRVPVVLTAIGSDLNRIPDPLCGRLTRWALRNADFVTTVSHDLSMTARRMGSDPGLTRANLNGCDTAVFHTRDRVEARQNLGLDSEVEIVVYVGRLDLRKGLLELIDSMAELRVNHPRAHCYLIGDGPAKSVLQARIATHKIGDKVTLIPSCATEQVAVWMAAADLVTLPSYMEGCPNVVIEALSSGRPVVATKVGGIPELMDELSGRLVPDRNVPALTEALHETLSRNWEPERISRAHSRSWQDVADDLAPIFKEILGRK